MVPPPTTPPGQIFSPRAYMLSSTSETFDKVSATTGKESRYSYKHYISLLFGYICYLSVGAIVFCLIEQPYEVNLVAYGRELSANQDPLYGFSRSSFVKLLDESLNLKLKTLVTAIFMV